MGLYKVAWGQSVLNYICLIICYCKHCIFILNSISQPSLLTLYTPAALVFIFILWICAYIIQLCFFYNMPGLLVRPTLIGLRLIWCIWTVFSYVSNHPAIITFWYSLLTYILHIHSSKLFGYLPIVGPNPLFSCLHAGNFQKGWKGHGI